MAPKKWGEKKNASKKDETGQKKGFSYISVKSVFEWLVGRESYQLKQITKPGILMQSEGAMDLFFFQEYKRFRNKIWAQAYGLNGYLLTSVNEWPAREHVGLRDKERQSSRSSSEKQGLR